MWLLTGVLGLFSIILFYVVYLSRKAIKNNDSVSVQQKINFIRKIIPFSRAKGWSLLTVDNGLRVWMKEINSSDFWYSGLVYGCSTLVSASSQDILTLMKDLRCISEWDPCVQQVSKLTVSTKHDVVSVSLATSGVVEKWFNKLNKLYGTDTNAIYSRHWNAEVGWVLTSLMQQPTISRLGFLWCGVVVQDKPNVSECLVSMVTAPAFSGMSASDVKMITSARVAGLKDFFDKASVSNNKTMPNGEVVLESSAEKPLEEVLDAKSSETAAEPVSNLLVAYREQEVGEFTHVSMCETDAKISNDSRIKEILEISLKAYNGKTGSDGWSLIGNMKDVEITKRIAKPGEKPFDTLKGVGLVKVPIHYVLAYLFKLDYRGEWDDMFVRGEVLEHLDGLTRILWVEFKALWPTSGRDFVSLVALREVSDGLYVVASAAGDDSFCPPKKGLVRGEILCNGIFVREVSSDPPCCQVTYVSRVDVKGSLPPKLVNRMTQSQPQAVAVLRDKLEDLYNKEKEQASDKEDMSGLQKEGVDLWVELMKRREVKENGEQESPQLQNSDESPKLYERVRERVESLESMTTTEEKSLANGSVVNGNAEEQSVELSGAQISGENINFPFVDRHHIDYKTLGNQSAAAVIGEVILASKAEISMPEDPGQQSRKEGEWSYQSIERDVVILRKINPGEKIHSFLGKGMIKSSPINVWNAVKNHMTRHIYDKTLKKTKMLKQIDESTRILYLHHETSQCFVKQARDFVILATDRVEPEKYVYAAVSVDIPESPPVKDLIRGKVYASGWVIEPVLQDGQLYSMVSYLSQLDFGGVLPVRLINYIARRQPLCIAYLREYLEKFKE